MYGNYGYNLVDPIISELSPLHSIHPHSSKILSANNPLNFLQRAQPLRMTSYYAQHRRLSSQTLEAYQRVNLSAHDRLIFYLNYFQDVVPAGIAVHHVPHHSSAGSRKGIELRTPTGRIFMSGLTSMESRFERVEQAAAEDAVEKYDRDLFVRDDGTIRVFTALTQLRVYSYFGGLDWEPMGVLPPIPDVKEMADFLQRQYDSVREL